MKVGLVGAGNIARALARGWGDPVLVSDGGSGRARELVAELGGEVVGSNRELAERADLVVLCHKPGQVGPVSTEIGGAANAVASVVGRISVDALQRAYLGVPVFRFMPNTAVEVRRGVLCYAAADGVDATLEREVLALFERLGMVVPLADSLMDLATVAMAGGPAYDAVVVEAQVDAAVRHGLAPELASRLMVETMAGTAELLRARGYDTLAVRREVTSPGGSTARGLDALDRAGLRGAFQAAIDAGIGGGSR